MANPSVSSPFLHLPLEIIRRILDFAVPVQHIRAQQFGDPTWTPPDGPTGIPSLLFVNKAISEEAAAVFYSRAVLDVAPLRPPAYLRNTLSASGPRLNLGLGLDLAFSFCPERHLKRLSTAKVYSGHVDAINDEAYEALLRWLVDNTAVRFISLSGRLMTRLRKARTDFDSTLALSDLSPHLSLTRTVYVYRERPQTIWEITRARQLRKILGRRKLPHLQSYVLEEDGGLDPLLDPRWDVRASDGDDRLALVDRIGAWMDSLVSADPVTQTPDEIFAENTYDLYQLWFVFKGPDSSHA